MRDHPNQWRASSPDRQRKFRHASFQLLRPGGNHHPYLGLEPWPDSAARRDPGPNLRSTRCRSPVPAPHVAPAASACSNPGPPLYSPTDPPPHTEYSPSPRLTPYTPLPVRCLTDWQNHLSTPTHPASTAAARPN